MRLLLSTYGSRGDVEPMAALAIRLHALGAQAVVCAPPDPEFARLLADADVPMVASGDAVRPLVTGTAPPRAGDFAARTSAVMTDHFDQIVTAAAGCDAIVATGMFPVAAAARTAADVLGIRYHHVSLQPTLLPSLHHPPPERPGHPLPHGVTDNRALWAHDAASMQALYGGPVDRLRAANGLQPLANLTNHVLTARPWLATDPVLSPRRTPDFEVEQTGAWIRPDTRPLPPDLEDFLAGGPPPVYIGFGSIPLRPREDAARVLIGAARRLGRRVVLASGWAGLAPIDDRDDRIVVGEANLQALFRRAAAVVHHGGAGTTITAALAGVPQVLVPQIVDQPYWARRVADLGIGTAHLGPSLTTRSLSAAIETTLSSEVRERASAVAATIRTDGADTAASLLLAG
ncbi:MULTISPECIES: glycosyltransferase [Glycomyces]|uniref:Glycosyltransferase n=2 Tax=Glycomyces TaxID=58113 RepID=A0A9X3PJG7_9ACTN|nr:glycosyltransferase [Glycomyces lechevalierae]MDA1385159.1 glycosyltransferase [Glycomyces lechevalierae]MDR7337225.1 vancomycin aglycone glucosyltransferase [Glycomyces lechevalierae]